MIKLFKATLVAVTMGLYSVAAQADAPLEISGATTVDAEQIIGLFDTHTDLMIVDSRKASDYSAGHIEGAVLLTNTEMDEQKTASVIPSKDHPVVFYCNGIKCGRAADAVEKALGFGYNKIYYYAKGMEEWNSLSMPVVTE